MVRSWISWSHDMTSISTMVINTIITTTMGMETIYPMGCGVVYMTVITIPMVRPSTA